MIIYIFNQSMGNNSAHSFTLILMHFFVLGMAVPGLMCCITLMPLPLLAPAEKGFDYALFMKNQQGVVHQNRLFLTEISFP